MFKKIPLLRCAVMAAIFPLLLAADAAPAPDAPISYSSPDIDTTPAMGMKFHGAFGNETFAATVDHLPPHDFLDITCDLLIIRTWDGSTQITEPDLKPAPIGPDFLSIALHGGPTLLYTTFCNLPDGRSFKGDKTQNYPSQIPGDLLTPAGSADLKNKLGYIFPDSGPATPVPMDSLYHLHFIIPHTAGDASLDFRGINLQDLHDESWGVGDVHIRPLTAAQVPKPGPVAIAAAFDTCAAADDAHSAALPPAFQTLVSGMDATVDWIDKNVKPVPVDASAVPDLITCLLDPVDTTEHHDTAHVTLMRTGIQVEPQLRDARKTAVGEGRLRLDWVLAALDVGHIDDPGLRRVMLATRALEVINTPAALALRKKLTQQ